jgi:hypothetical protein
VVLYLSSIEASGKLHSMSTIDPNLGYSSGGNYGGGRPPLGDGAMTGRAAVALPRDMDSQLRQLAKRDDTSLGHVIRAALEKGIPLLI